MPKFRKKPVFVTAVRYTEEMRDAHIFDSAPLPAGLKLQIASRNLELRVVYRADAYIDRPDGRVEVELGDWLITSADGEHSACNPRIFSAIYEPVDDSADSRESGAG